MQEEVAAAEHADDVAVAEAHELLGIIHVRRGRAEDAVRFLQAAYASRVVLQTGPTANRARLEKVRALQRRLLRAYGPLPSPALSTVHMPGCSFACSSALSSRPVSFWRILYLVCLHRAAAPCWSGNGRKRVEALRHEAPA